jgi:hypothetical protein
VIGSALLFLPTPFLSWLLLFGPDQYYISQTTLRQYLVQILLTHIYILPLLPLLLKKDVSTLDAVFRGWFFGVMCISVGLSILGYFSRIPDYSFPLAFMLLVRYWMSHKRFRFVVIFTTTLVLFLSQLIVFNDPFSLRRYYTQAEVDSVKQIISMGLSPRTVVSDMRTAVLFRFLGDAFVVFFGENSIEHQKVFYQDGLSPLFPGHRYVVLSENMRYIVYATNFETTPINDAVFSRYDSLYTKIYDDGLMKVYDISSRKIFQ